jgi:dihydrolipoamide dehydrogenase
MENHSYDVTVIGAGPGGYIAAIRAAQRGKRVAIVERDRLGGVCLNWGCIPTKALLKMAERRDFLREASDWGFEIGDVHVDWDKVIERSRGAADRLAGGVRFLMKKNKIDVHTGSGRFLSANRIAVDKSDGSTIELSTTHTIIATGARASTLAGVELDGERVISSKEAMVLPELPKSMIVIGAGAIGLEFAYFYSVFGCQVSLVEYFPRILPSGDEEVCQALTRSFEKRGIEILAGSKVLSIERDGDGVRVSVDRDGQIVELDADVALVAVGVKANTEGLGLERLGVELERGVISVNEHVETRASGVYAIGDVNGPPALAHVASAEGLHVVSHLCGDDPEPFDRTNIPSCIYCYPQIASVGLTEGEAREKGHDVKIGRFPFTANGKAVAIGETEGFVKIVAEASTGEILGAHIIGPDATEMIGELTLGKAAELTVHDIHGTIHSHPTLSESIMEAAADWAGEATQM